MRKLIASVAALGLLAGGALADETDKSKDTIVTAETDPNLWLEEVEGEAALAWVRKQCNSE